MSNQPHPADIYETGPTAGNWPNDETRNIAIKYLKDDPTFRAEIVRDMIACIDPEPEREGLKDTPRRVTESWKELFAGYKMKPDDILKEFDGEGYDEVVLVRGIEFHSVCEHHMIGFSGTASVAYIPQDMEYDKVAHKLKVTAGKIFGLSKLARLVECFARRLTVQERITQQVVDALAAKTKGAACVLIAKHGCMSCRGVKQSSAETVTSCLSGVFLDKPEARAELFSLIRG